MGNLVSPKGCSPEQPLVFKRLPSWCLYAGLSVKRSFLTHRPFTTAKAHFLRIAEKGGFKASPQNVALIGATAHFACFIAHSFVLSDL